MPNKKETTFFSISNIDVTHPILDSMMRLALNETFKPREMHRVRHLWIFSKDYCQIDETHILIFLKILMKLILTDDHLNVVSQGEESKGASEKALISIPEVVNTVMEYTFKLNEEILLCNLNLLIAFFEYEGKVLNLLSIEELESRGLKKLFISKNEFIFRKARIFHQLLLKETFSDVLLFRCFVMKNREIALNFLNKIYEGIVLENDFSSIFRKKN